MGFERKNKCPSLAPTRYFLQAEQGFKITKVGQFSQMKNWKVLILAGKNPIQNAQGDKPPPCQTGLMLIHKLY